MNIARLPPSHECGAQVKALAVCSQLKSVHVWKPVLLLAVDRMYSLSTGLGEYSESPEEQCRCLYEAINSLSTASMPSVTPTQREVHRLMLAQGSAQKEVAHVGHVHWPPGSASHIPVRVPPLMQLQEVADASVTHLLRKFKSGLLCAFHAMPHIRDSTLNPHAHLVTRMIYTRVLTT